MRKDQMPAIIEEYFVAYGLHEMGWKYGFGKAQTYYGIAYFERKKIVFSVPMHEYRNEDFFRNTVAHEVCHALVDDRYTQDHSPEWISKAKEMGVDAKMYE